MSAFKRLKRGIGHLLRNLLVIGFIVGLVGFFVGMGGWLGYRAIDEVYTYVTLQREGVETRGRFVEKRFTTSTDDNGNTSYTYYVTFRFNVGEESYVVEDRVRERTYDTADNGEPLNVLYAQSNPNIARIETLRWQRLIEPVILCLCWNSAMLGFVLIFFISR